MYITSHLRGFTTSPSTLGKFWSILEMRISVVNSVLQVRIAIFSPTKFCEAIIAFLLPCFTPDQVFLKCLADLSIYFKDNIGEVVSQRAEGVRYCHENDSLICFFSET